MSRGIEFIQESATLQNQFISDPWLQHFLEWRLPKEQWQSAKADLEKFAIRVGPEMMTLAKQAEAQEPRLVQFDAWGKRIDQIEMSPAWDALAAIAAEEGIVAHGYERRMGQNSRLFQLAKLYLYHPSSAVFSCPLAMTDGAARIVELLAPKEVKTKALTRLTSRDPQHFWTSGQWMTEKTGGSDVSETSTVARPKGGHYELTGIKWFTSSVTSQMALALARIDGAPEGSRGLSLFYLETHRPDGSLNNIRVLRLKNKLGTKALPTAELELQGVPAILLGDPGQGIKNIATMLNITRLYNSVCATAQMRRGLSLWQDFAQKRFVFGKPMAQHPLFQETYGANLINFVTCLVLTMSVAELLGKEECNEASPDETQLLRFLTPLTKLYTGKHSIWTMSEVLEGFGGTGYLEDSGIPVLFRDAQVFPIWEGPTNVLSLDVLRVLSKGEAWAVMKREMETQLNECDTKSLAAAIESARSRLRQMDSYLNAMKSASPDDWQAQARSLSLGLSELFAGIKLLSWAKWVTTQKTSTFVQTLTSVANEFWRRPGTSLRPAHESLYRTLKS